MGASLVVLAAPTVTTMGSAARAEPHSAMVPPTTSQHAADAWIITSLRQVPGLYAPREYRIRRSGRSEMRSGPDAGPDDDSFAFSPQDGAGATMLKQSKRLL